jgi:hypothetical protein
MSGPNGKGPAGMTVQGGQGADYFPGGAQPGAGPVQVPMTDGMYSRTIQYPWSQPDQHHNPMQGGRDTFDPQSPYGLYMNYIKNAPYMTGGK